MNHKHSYISVTSDN